MVIVTLMVGRYGYGFARVCVCVCVCVVQVAGKTVAEAGWIKVSLDRLTWRQVSRGAEFIFWCLAGLNTWRLRIEVKW